MSDPVIEPSEILVDGQGTIRDDPIRANPWLRLLARFFDYSLFFMLLLILRKLNQGQLPLGRLESIVPYEYFVWIPIEAALLRFWGTTPGKWFIGTDLRQGRRPRLDFMTALQRSFKVWFRGLGMGIPIVNAICMLVAYNRLKVFKITSWDRDDHILVTHRRVGRWRIYLAAAIAICGIIVYSNTKDYSNNLTQPTAHNGKVI